MQQRKKIYLFSSTQGLLNVVSICPRHPDYPDLLVDYEDKEKKCGVAKSIRLGVSSEFPGVLKLEGLTLREYTAKKKWGSMTPDEQNVRKKSDGKCQGSYCI